jgi:hypothetical protein
MMTLKQILQRRRADLALIVGNGIHRYRPESPNSWDKLLMELARRYGVDVDRVPQGTSATEFFDLLELRAGGRSGELARAFCDLMKGWRPLAHHERIMGWAVRHEVPVLTTNFDEVLSDAVGARLMRPRGKGFTSYYPWDSRFAARLHDNPCDGFGIWHINGLARYARSVRLGLTHYMGLAQRARPWLHHGENRLFKSRDGLNWPGRRTWLHLIFNKPLLIFGLGLREDEVFLRWLLIERARYLSWVSDRHHDAWYVYLHDPKDPTEAGRIFFLERIGIRCIPAASYDSIYANAGWKE